MQLFSSLFPTTSLLMMSFFGRRNNYWEFTFTRRCLLSHDSSHLRWTASQTFQHPNVCLFVLSLFALFLLESTPSLSVERYSVPRNKKGTDLYVIPNPHTCFTTFLHSFRSISLNITSIYFFYSVKCFTLKNHSVDQKPYLGFIFRKHERSYLKRPTLQYSYSVTHIHV